jgi:peptidoglycan L-alanyl-D-glutamate endopeptidase CwlK
MPSFGPASMAQLSTCDARLQKLFIEVVKHFDCKVTCGFRNQADQEAAFAAGNTEKHWPDGNHNKLPSYAVDVAPYPVDYEDVARIRVFAGFVLGIASLMNLKVRWGGDWNQDTQVKDNKFNDLVHFEIQD